MHAAEYEGRPQRRPLTRAELQAFLDAADDHVDRAAGSRRKGWLAAFRDATLFKVVYGWGLRRRETAMLDVADFAVNPAAPELGGLGICHVRYGKAMRGSPPRRRAVATVMPWTAEALAQYISEVRPCHEAARHPALWLTERGGRISPRQIDDRFAQWRAAAGLPAGLSVHCLRHFLSALFPCRDNRQRWAGGTATCADPLPLPRCRLSRKHVRWVSLQRAGQTTTRIPPNTATADRSRTYISHLIEDGADPLFVQQQAGHSWASTTAVYTVKSRPRTQAARPRPHRPCRRRARPLPPARRHHRLPRPPLIIPARITQTAQQWAGTEDRRDNRGTGIRSGTSPPPSSRKPPRSWTCSTPASTCTTSPARSSSCSLDRKEEWLAARLEDLDYGAIDGIVRAARQYPLEGVKKDEIDSALGYFQNNAPRMRYHWFRQCGLFVGSGVVEASCKSVVGQRLKQAGMHWTVGGADAIIALRCKEASSTWDAICNTPHTQTRTA